MKIHELNNLLGQELGRRTDGHPIFAWKNSDELFWPAFDTGQRTLVKKVVEVPILGLEEPMEPLATFIEELVPVYQSDRQMRARNVWVVTKWMDPEALIWGWIGRHGGEAMPTVHPTRETLVRMWEERFPGADFPHNGWRVPTDATLPRSPGGNSTPNESDTRYFIACVKEQTRLSFDDRLKDMLASEDRQEATKDKLIADEVREAFPAFLNPTPGKRSNFVSLPWTRKDRL